MKKFFLLLSFVAFVACNSDIADPATPVQGEDAPDTTPKTVRFVANIPADQTVTASGYDTTAISSVTVPVECGIDFDPIMSFFSFSLSGDDKTISQVKSIKITTTSEDPSIQPFGTADVIISKDSWTGDYGYELSAVSGLSKNSATLSGDFTSGEYAFIAFPCSCIGVKYLVKYDDGTDFTTEDADFDFSTSLGTGTELPGLVLKSDGSGENNPPVVPPVKPDPESKGSLGWFELPSYTDADHNGIDDNNTDYYYSNTYRADAPKIRNFSCCYSKSKIHPVWVAAPMHSCYKGKSGRTGGYKPDPNISCTQAGKWTGYNRGHMLGSSDRTVSAATNRQVFYYSNIGAQLQMGFNTGDGAWNNLESLVDEQWCSDTLYQVIGCIFDTWTDKYGHTVEAKTCDGSQIPTAYYKVLLRTKSGKSGKSVDKCTASELKCCAFILAHRNDKGHDPCANDLYSVEDAEKLTGLTFFVNVPNAPKSTALASDWGL